MINELHRSPCRRQISFQFMYLTLTTSREQGQSREGMSEGSLRAKLRADGEKRHRRPTSLWRAGTRQRSLVVRGDTVNGTVVCPNEVTKRPWSIVNIYVLSVSKGVQTSGKICSICGRCGHAIRTAGHVERHGITAGRYNLLSARDSATHDVIWQKSADGVVAKSPL
jgi:hypothetical protein